jgi:hypothetical protein
VRRPQARELRRSDLAILGVSALFGVWLCIATDREYAAGFGRSRARVSEATRLPDWIKERRRDAIRVAHAGCAFLTAIGLGLVMVVSRPVSPTRCPGPFAPGTIAAILTGGFALALATGWILLRAIPGMTNVRASSPILLRDFYSTWRDGRAIVSWIIVGAWSTLLATGRVATSGRRGRPARAVARHRLARPDHRPGRDLRHRLVLSRTATRRRQPDGARPAPLLAWRPDDLPVGRRRRCRITCSSNLTAVSSG